jgi:hypothetical protein
VHPAYAAAAWESPRLGAIRSPIHLNPAYVDLLAPVILHPGSAALRLPMQGIESVRAIEGTLRDETIVESRNLVLTYDGKARRNSHPSNVEDMISRLRNSLLAS